MGSTYSIRLCRSWRFRLFSAIVFVGAIAYLYFCVFGKLQDGILAYLLPNGSAQGWEIFRAVMRGARLLIGMLFGLAVLALSGMGLFFNRIFVRENAVWVFCAPRKFSREWKADIHAVQKVLPEQVSKMERLKSLNFSKENLYRFVCYDTTFLVTAKDHDAMRTLMLDINPRNNPRECDDPDYDPTKLTWGEWFLLELLEDILWFIFG